MIIGGTFFSAANNHQKVSGVKESATPDYVWSGSSNWAKQIIIG